LFDLAAGRTWSKGYGAAGYSLYSNVTALIPSASGYPVHYPASFSLTSQSEGISDMTTYLTRQASACPQKKFALGGHSQGGFVTVETINALSANILSRIVAVTMFGSPACPTSVAAKCISYCQAVRTPSYLHSISHLLSMIIEFILW
jgi:surfactin synthase thioesterase subunit